MLNRSALTLSDLGTRAQDLTSDDLILITQETPDGLRSVKATVGDLLSYVLDQPQFLSLTQQQFLRAVSVQTNDPVLSGNGTDASPLKTDISLLNRTFTTKEETNALIETLNTLANRVTRAENTLISITGQLDDNSTSIPTPGAGLSQDAIYDILNGILHVDSLHETVNESYHPGRMIYQLTGHRTVWKKDSGTIFLTNAISAYSKDINNRKIRWRRFPDNYKIPNIGLTLSPTTLLQNQEKDTLTSGKVLHRVAAYLCTQHLAPGTEIYLTNSNKRTVGLEQPKSIKFTVGEDGNAYTEFTISHRFTPPEGTYTYWWSTATAFFDLEEAGIKEATVVISNQSKLAKETRGVVIPPDWLSRPVHQDPNDATGRSLYVIDPRVNPISFPSIAKIKFSGSLVSFLRVIPPANEIILDENGKFDANQIENWQPVQNEYVRDYSNATSPAVNTKIMAFATVPSVPTYAELDLKMEFEYDGVVVAMSNNTYIFDEYDIDKIPKPIGL